jgi:hypothetical protein
MTLRRLTATDSDRVHPWRDSPEVAAHMYADRLISSEAHARPLAGDGAQARETRAGRRALNGYAAADLAMAGEPT